MFHLFLQGDGSPPNDHFRLSFEISPRNNEMKSFTLPASGRSSRNTIQESTSSFKPTRSQTTRKSPSSLSTSSLSDQSQEKIEIVCSSSCNKIIMILSY